MLLHGLDLDLTGWFQDAFRSLDLTGKTIIVTGSGSGIGRATAKLLAACGASVAVADFNDDGGSNGV
jgi:phosphoglycerate dehydrogenase-like enzyme